MSVSPMEVPLSSFMMTLDFVFIHMKFSMDLEVISKVSQLMVRLTIPPVIGWYVIIEHTRIENEPTLTYTTNHLSID